MTTPTTILEFELNTREADYREWLRKWIMNKHQGFVLAVERRKAYLKTPEKILRHPPGFPSNPEGDEYMLHWYWSDALYCSDVSYEAPAEFFEEDYDNFNDDRGPGGEELMERLDNIFNECFCEVMPEEFHGILEG